MPEPKSIAQSILSAVDDVLIDSARPIPLHVPSFAGKEWDYVKECLDTGWVSSVGAYVTRFEEDMARYTGAKHAIAVGTGTAALHVALLMAGVEPGDEVLCPSLTFVATANAISYCQAVPHFVDIDATTLGIDPAAIRAYTDEHFERRDDGYSYNKQTARRIGALVGMHAFGHPFELDGVVQLCDDLGCPLVEDAAESLGSFYKGKHTGTFGRLGTISYNGNKIITTGGGGMILTDDADLAAQAKHLTTTGKAPHKYEYVHDVVAYNYRMPNLNAAVGCAQLEEIDNLLNMKRSLTQRYIDAFEK
ncbi:MAG: LegC family aminotransferase, partial [Planctomycetota bacterium]